MPSPSFDREAIEAEIDRVRSLGLDGLRTLWRTTFRSSPPPAFTKDLIALLGGLDPETSKHLASLARSRADRPRRFKTGTVLVREYQGERHTVTVVAYGFVTYASLSTIARAITGTNWNGPRFFGLRIDKETTDSSAAANAPPASPNGRTLPGPPAGAPAYDGQLVTP